MTKEIVVSETDNIAAVFENGRVVEFFMNEGEQLVGDIILGCIDSTIPSIDAAFINIGKNQNGFIHISDLALKIPPKKRSNIRHFLTPKKNILVQIAKEATSSKGPRLTEMLTIPGKYLILTPYERKIGISKRIEDQFEKDRLIYVAKNLCQAGYGIILRTEAQFQSEEALKEDLDYLLKRWSEILTLSEKAVAPAVLYRDQDLLYKVLRESITTDIKKIVVDTPEAKNRAVELLQSWSNEAFRFVQFNKNTVPLAAQYNLFTELEKALQTKVYLPSGGSLVIEKTEAMTVIDINSGGTRETVGLSDTILRTNKEAAVEIARQIRLRDIGGVIVIDFIDMFEQRDQQLVWQTLANETKNDRSQPQLSYFSEFSLLEITRHRQKKSLIELLTTKCPTCDGVGRLRNSVYRADMITVDSSRRRTNFSEPNQPNAKVEFQGKSKIEDLTENVEFFEKQTPPPEYEKYKKRNKENDITFVENDSLPHYDEPYYQDEAPRNEVRNEVKNDNRHENKPKFQESKPAFVKPQAQQHQHAPKVVAEKAPVAHHNHNHSHKVVEPIIEKIEAIKEPIINTLPIVHVENFNKIVEEKAKTEKTGSNFFELSAEERKYIQHIDTHSSRRPADKFNKNDRNNFNDKPRFENPRQHEPRQNDPRRNDKPRFENPRQHEPRQNQVNNFNEETKITPVIGNSAENFNEIPKQIVNETIPVLAQEVNKEVDVVDQNNLHVQDTAFTVNVPDSVKEVSLDTSDLLNVAIEKAPEEPVIEEKLEEVVPKKRGRKPRKAVKPKEEALQEDLFTPEEKAVEVIVEIPVVETPKVSEVTSEETVESNDDDSEAEDSENGIDSDVKKKKKFRKIRSFAPKKKKK
ncbi:MAG: Rne/Rng family ribonuclease [Cyanobacteriota bacterium]